MLQASTLSVCKLIVDEENKMMEPLKGFRNIFHKSVVSKISQGKLAQLKTKDSVGQVFVRMMSESTTVKVLLLLQTSGDYEHTKGAMSYFRELLEAREMKKRHRSVSSQWEEEVERDLYSEEESVVDGVMRIKEETIENRKIKNNQGRGESIQRGKVSKKEESEVLEKSRRKKNKREERKDYEDTSEAEDVNEQGDRNAYIVEDQFNRNDHENNDYSKESQNKRFDNPRVMKGAFQTEERIVHTKRPPVGSEREDFRSTNRLYETRIIDPETEETNSKGKRAFRSHQDMPNRDSTTISQERIVSGGQTEAIET